MLQAVNGRISKIAPYIELVSKEEANRIAMPLLKYCMEQLGKPAEQKTGLFIWDTTDGNVILQTAENMAGLTISRFFTLSLCAEF